MKIKLGDKCRDTVTGFVGIAVARTTWLNGCERLTLQPPVDKDGKVPENVTFDEPQVERLGPQAAQGPRDTGGPIPTPRQHEGPTR